MNDDIFIEDIFDNEGKPKKKNSGRKGKSGELQIVKILNSRFGDILSKNPTWGRFSRSIGSGNRFSQTSLSQSANNFYSGDVICENFKFVIESKNGYDIDFITAFVGNKQIDSFLKQVSNDADRCNKMPMLIWKKNRKQPLVFIKELPNLNKFKYVMHYNDWVVVDFGELLKVLSDEFFFCI